MVQFPEYQIPDTQLSRNSLFWHIDRYWGIKRETLKELPKVWAGQFWAVCVRSKKFFGKLFKTNKNIKSIKTFSKSVGVSVLDVATFGIKLVSMPLEAASSIQLSSFYSS